MASAIISDTILLTSPTTTLRDSDALINLSKIPRQYLCCILDYLIFGLKILKLMMKKL